jgi:hypothetical protein
VTLRIVVYGEGPGESGFATRRTPGHRLSEEDLGAAHILCRRVLVDLGAVPHAAVVFEAGLRLRGRVPTGSDLHGPSELRKLLAFVSSPPDLVVVLIDSDGRATERRRLVESIPFRATAPRFVLGVAVEEFESWLVADAAAVTAAVQREVSTTPDPESFAPGRAKEIWAGYVAHLDKDRRARARLDVALHLRLDELRRRCRSFESFSDQLGS